MAKKDFVAPYLKVVRVHNDIIATSAQLGIGDDVTSGSASAPDYKEWEEE